MTSRPDRHVPIKPAGVGRFPRLGPNDLRGLAQLATQATVGVTDIVEGVHRSVMRTMALPVGRQKGRTSGLTGLIYSSVRGITRLVGHGADRALHRMQKLLPAQPNQDPASAQRESLLAALNGVLGDRMAADGNPMATTMQFRLGGEALQQPMTIPASINGTRILLMIHGLCMNELQWRASSSGPLDDDCDKLAVDLGYQPVYLRYNTGLHVSQNGRELSRQLETLTRHWPVPVCELGVLAHSMGGLVIRSALHFAAQEKHRWPALLKSIVFLGTPHHGAPLERAGSWIDVLLGATPWSAPFARLGQLRSAGITDLRYSLLTDSDWRGQDRFRRTPERHTHVPLPVGVRCFAIAATLTGRNSRLAEQLLGDGLVPLDSALGRHPMAGRCLAFDGQSCWIAYGTSHMALLRDPQVMRQVRSWLAATSEPEYAV